MNSMISGEHWLQLWVWLFIASGLVVAIVTGWLKARKVQPGGFKWKQFRFELMIAAITLLISGNLIGLMNRTLMAHHIITFQHGPAAWWVIALEYTAYFFGFDTYFYWLHRWMHNEPVYRWVHKLHHRSTSPNLLTTLSVHPLESVINGSFLAIFTSLVSVHDTTMALMVPTNIVMGLYVHSGYELLPRWWNRTWLTKWFISATFHDQHHRYFTGNFGGYTTLWDRLCGTMRPKFEADFAKPKSRARESIGAGA